MKKVFLSILFLLCILGASSQNQSFTINPKKTEAGKKVTITYSGKSAKEGNSLIFTAYSEKFIKEDIRTKFVNNQLVGTLTLPDTLTYIYVSVKDGDLADGIGINSYKNGKISGESRFDEANTLMMMRIIGADESLKQMDKVIQINPNIKEKRTTDYALALYLSEKHTNEALPFIEKVISKRKKNGKNENLDKLYLMRQLFIFQDIVKAKEPKNVINLAKQYKAEFPNISDEQKVKLNIALATAYNELAWNQVSKDEELQKAKEHSLMSLNCIDSIFKISSTFTSKHRERLEGYLKQSKGNYLDTYALIMSKLGDKKSAIKLQEQAIETIGGTNSEINSRLIQFLLDDNQNKRALTEATKFIIANKSNQQTDSLHKLAYSKVNGNIKDYANELLKLEEKRKGNITEEIKKEMVNIPVKNFILKDLNGNIVKLSELKGKIVILDFWATWCGPCVHSFPAMQKAKSELQNKGVEFLFINTFERSKPEKRLKAINTLLNSKGYKINVLLDEKSGNNFKVASDYEVNAIPAKFIIDRNGYLRHQSKGFSKAEELIDELKTVVEIIDNEK